VILAPEVVEMMVAVAALAAVETMNPPDAGSRADDDEEESMDDINPNWDTFDHSAFGYARHRPDDIRAEHARRQQPSLEPDWKEIQLNHDNIIYDAATNQVYQWRAYHPINGLINCIPARIGMKYINEELFVASLCPGHFDSTNQKLFERRFPSYGHGDPLLTYLSHVVEHALQYKFFISPLQKLHPDGLLGSWEQGALPPWVRLAAVTTMPGILANCLGSKTANLYCDPSYGAIVRANQNGYETFRQIMSLAGHPSLSPFAVTRDPPKQRADCPSKPVLHRLTNLLLLLALIVFATFAISPVTFLMIVLCSSRSLVILAANAVSSRSSWVATLATPVVALLVARPELSPSMPWRTCR
jgi:hypothetical protein